MTFRQFIEQGTQFSSTGFGKVAGRAGQSAHTPEKPQIQPLHPLGKSKKTITNAKSGLKLKSLGPDFSPVRIKGIL